MGGGASLGRVVPGLIALLTFFSQTTFTHSAMYGQSWVRQTYVSDPKQSFFLAMGPPCALLSPIFGIKSIAIVDLAAIWHNFSKLPEKLLWAYKIASHRRQCRLLFSLLGILDDAPLHHLRFLISKLVRHCIYSKDFTGSEKLGFLLSKIWKFET